MAPPQLPLAGEGAIAAPAETSAPAYKNPFLWVPSSYLTMGLIYVTVGAVANIMFKNMGMANDQAAFWSSILGFPYTFKFLWAPALELYKTKKFFVVLMQFAISAALVGVAFGLRLPGTSLDAAGADAGRDHRRARARRRTSAPTASTSPRCRPRIRPSTSASRACAGTAARCSPRGRSSSSAARCTTAPEAGRRPGWSSCWRWARSCFWPASITAGCFRRAPRRSKPKSFGDAMKTFGHAFVSFFQKKDVASHDRVRVPLSVRLRPARQDGAAVPDRLPRQPRARALEPGRRRRLRHVRQRRVHRRARCWAASSCRAASLKKTLLLLCLCINVPNATFLFLSQAMPDQHGGHHRRS